MDGPGNKIKLKLKGKADSCFRRRERIAKTQNSPCPPKRVCKTQIHVSDHAQNEEKDNREGKREPKELHLVALLRMKILMMRGGKA